MPLLAELVDEQFAAQYGYVYAAAQTAASAAYAFGPLVGGALLNRRLLSFASLMHLVGLANLTLCLLAFAVKEVLGGREKRKNSASKKVSFQSPEMEDQEEKVRVKFCCELFFSFVISFVFHKLWIRMQQMSSVGQQQHQQQLGGSSIAQQPYNRFDWKDKIQLKWLELCDY